ncbi:unnamed protein product [Mytilus edulis]|uniref:Uncharacterized protein n=1 Tax=Mytilus edulis TaxID=6550 RepID=A0A8S3UAP4_MYTED|nr:unnamed protein product [Mytilus edulis]
MWTSLATQSKYDRWWLPNHFVACTKGTIEEAQPTSHQEPTGLTLADFFYPMSRAKTIDKAKIIEADTGTNTNTSTVNLDTIHKLDLADSVTKVKSEPILSMNQEPNKYSSTNIAAMEPEIIHKDDKSENMTEAGCEKVSQFDTKQDITTNVTEGTPDTVCEQDEPEIRTATGSEPLSQPDTFKEPDYIMDGEQHFHEDLPENLLYENVSFQFYYKMGRLAALNESRDKTRYLNPIEKDHENVDKKVKRTLLNETIISKLEPLQKKMMCEVKRLKRAHISAIIASGRYILDHGPIVKTQNLCNVFF